MKDEGIPDGFCCIAILLLIFFVWLSSMPLAYAEQLYVDSSIGHDANSGILTEPLQTIEEAVRRANSASEAGPTLIGIAPGVYVLQRTVVFENKRLYTDRNRLIIEATVLPGDPEWKPSLMPVIQLAHTVNISALHTLSPDEVLKPSSKGRCSLQRFLYTATCLCLINSQRSLTECPN